MGPQRVFSLVETSILVDFSQLLPWFFTHLLREDSFHFSSTRNNVLAFQPFLQYFATGSHGTASCKDYKDCEFVDCLLEETQIINTRTVSFNHISFVNTKLATHLSSCRFWRKNTSENIHLFLLSVIPFISLNLYSLAIRPLLLCFHTLK